MIFIVFRECNCSMMETENLMERFRKWRATGLGRAVESGETEIRDGDTVFRIMSYNILAPVFAERHQHLYTGDPDQLSWEVRWERIQQEILSLQPDIISLQEVQFLDNVFRNDVQPWLEEAGYDNVHMQRPNDKEDGCVIAFKRTKFK